MGIIVSGEELKGAIVSVYQASGLAKLWGLSLSNLKYWNTIRYINRDYYKKEVFAMKNCAAFFDIDGTISREGLISEMF